ncbi:uncharacterized protein B0I36DRAFT_309219 [Microdochium trichocladiopsis]|uniref:N-acetylgalactosaminide beta-1,3-galactosyltransferase n=1 Tax=Microdochium trichocladiopsis TaxID=1682393 RepID=A0A9P8YDE0_9PEZI|nr:uncharacterized protein B0I36DRAFT_309219 [Microdochium trichocladiopsis]KAH7039752.1 hypothetical protein B0I36DRAFT_309219 [Microdochium trichocladiopsis]
MRRAYRSARLTIILVISVLVLYSLTPYDSSIRSFFRFHSNVIEDYVQEKHPSDAWLFKEQRWPVDAAKDIGIIVKTGFGTRDRVPRALYALANESLIADIVVTQDFPVSNKAKDQYKLAGKPVPVVDIVGWNLERGALAAAEHLERISKYRHLAAAVEAEEWQLADGLGKSMGWELDALKFLSSLEYVWLNMPKKKWYLMLDDDTYVIKHSLNLLLGHLDPAKPQLIGNPVGDYKGRFPHGGSSVIISGSAMSKLYDLNPQVVAEGHLESASITWGDKLLSTTFMKVGVYLDETYRRMFNGENPWTTRMWIDRFCAPLLSFHALGDKETMEEVSITFGKMTKPVFWRDLADIYGAPSFSSFLEEPIRANMEYVGRLDEYSTTVQNVDSVEKCQRICQFQNSDRCLAWSYDPRTKVCNHAPWAIIGDYLEGRLSGINPQLATTAANRCHPLPAALTSLY